jgi:8-oxo-dGTP pyrophosphatase MutT (NUDIX family)
MPAWEDSYLGKLRALAGDKYVLMVMGTRAVARDDDGRVLLIRRSDNGFWSFPAGTMELGQSLHDCAVRELYEETGLTALGVTPFALSSGLGAGPNMYGHTYQPIMLSCRVDGWRGELLRETDETIDAGFFAPDAFPEPLSGSVRAALAQLDRFEKDGGFILE